MAHLNKRLESIAWLGEDADCAVQHIQSGRLALRRHTRLRQSQDRATEPLCGICDEPLADHPTVGTHELSEMAWRRVRSSGVKIGSTSPPSNETHSEQPDSIDGRLFRHLFPTTQRGTGRHRQGRNPDTPTPHETVGDRPVPAL